MIIIMCRCALILCVCRIYGDDNAASHSLFVNNGDADADADAETMDKGS